MLRASGGQQEGAEKGLDVVIGVVVTARSVSDMKPRSPQDEQQGPLAGGGAGSGGYSQGKREKKGRNGRLMGRLRKSERRKAVGQGRVTGKGEMVRLVVRTLCDEVTGESGVLRLGKGECLPGAENAEGMSQGENFLLLVGTS